MREATPPSLREYASSVEILSYIHTSRRSSSVETIFGDPRTWATPAPLIPTLISFWTVPTVIRSPELSWTDFLCFAADIQPANNIRAVAENNNLLTIHLHLLLTGLVKTNPASRKLEPLLKSFHGIHQHPLNARGFQLHPRRRRIVRFFQKFSYGRQLVKNRKIRPCPTSLVRCGSFIYLPIHVASILLLHVIKIHLFNLERKLGKTAGSRSA